jgi:hypothetical protein
MKNPEAIGVQIPQILLPRPGIDLGRWAVIACDQFTSQPEYWADVEQFVGEAPSTLNLIFPEVYLEQPGGDERISRIQQKMRAYLDGDIFEPYTGLIYIERAVAGKTRKGLMLALDLEHYDYNKGSTSLIRATEGTILERIPPRVKIRNGAPLELPHILVLIDDPQRTVVEPLEKIKDRLPRRYDFDLMLDSGHLSGYLVNDPTLEEQVIGALAALARPEVFAAKYGVSRDLPVLLFAMGDGNHSLATAKAYWEQIKTQMGDVLARNHPARYALVEIENVHDEGLAFEPIHRVLFGLKRDILAEMQAHFAENYAFRPVASAAEMVAAVDQATGPRQAIGAISGTGFGVIEIAHPGSNLPVGTLQTFLDPFLKSGGAEKVDYVHGLDVVCSLGAKSGNIGFYVPGMAKGDLFKTVILDGALPRKTFSMGEAREKRFYMECRGISDQ